MVIKELENLVYSTLTYGWQLRERLERGEQPDLLTEQAVLKRLLLGDTEAKRWAEYGGEEAGPVDLRGGGRGGGDLPRQTAARFLGVRYALISWLDEMFTTDSSWHGEWTENKLESSLYGTNDRAWKFWEQARLAEQRLGSDALEVYYLCVMLGFRGELVEMNDQLTAWVNAVRARLGESQIQEWPAPPRLEPRTHVPPLHARQQMQRMVVFAGLVLLLFLPLVTAFVVWQLAK